MSEGSKQRYQPQSVVTVRMSPELHKELVKQGHLNQMSLNRLCRTRLEVSDDFWQALVLINWPEIIEVLEKVHNSKFSQSPRDLGDYIPLLNQIARESDIVYKKLNQEG